MSPERRQTPRRSAENVNPKHPYGTVDQNKIWNKSLKMKTVSQRARYRGLSIYREEGTNNLFFFLLKLPSKSY